MYSHIVDGKVLDISTKKCKDIKGRYIVYLGQTYIGQLYKMKFGWSVVTANPHPFSGLTGFINKWKAYEILIKAFDDNRNTKE